MKWLTLLAAAAFSLTCPTAGFSQPVAIDLGTLGGIASVATGVNTSGQVAVTNEHADRTDRAHVWHPDGGYFVDLGTLGGSSSAASAINGAGHVVGISWYPADAEGAAYLWTPERGMTGLGTLGSSSVATALNDADEVVGYSYLPTGDHHAFLWTAAEGMIDLGPLHSSGDSIARGINNHGEVVGELGFSRAFLWTRSGGMIDLGTPTGAINFAAMGITDDGVIIGWSTLSSGGAHAFTWTRTGGWVDLGTLGGERSFGYAGTTSGQVVGFSQRAEDTGGIFGRAFSWTSAAGMKELGTIGGSHGVGYAVNDTGVVAGSSSTLHDFEEHATIWYTNPHGYDFNGSFLPPPLLNVVAAGRATASFRFSLHGDHGLSVFAAGYPRSIAIPCQAGDPTPPRDETSAGGALTYKAPADKYQYLWRAGSAWRGTCRQLILFFNDGTLRLANFRFD